MKRFTDRQIVNLILILSLIGIIILSAFLTLGYAPISANDTQANPATTGSSANIYFNETGLPSGVKWVVFMSGLDPYNEPVQTTQYSTTSQLEQASTYQQGLDLSFVVYQVSSNGQTYNPSPSSGTILLSNVNNYVNVAFTKVSGNLFQLNVIGLGLPYPYSGLPWSGFITNNQSIFYSIHTSSLSYTQILPNGTYYFQINGSANHYYPYIVGASNTGVDLSGYFSMSGDNYTLTIGFNTIYTNETYYISFVASGFTNGTRWTLTFNNTNYSENSNTVYLPVKLGYTYNVSANATGYAYEGVRSVYLYSFNQQVSLPFVSNYSHPVNFLANGLGIIGISVTGFWGIVFLLASIVLVGISTYLDWGIYVTVLLPLVLLWIALGIGVIGYMIPSVSTIGAFAAVIIDMRDPKQGGRPA